jgi:hypothetical protein
MTDVLDGLIPMCGQMFWFAVPVWCLAVWVIDKIRDAVMSV